MKKATLVYIVDDGEVLMAKKTQKVGIGCYFGYGGKKKWWQTFRGCAVREVWEETGGVKSKRWNGPSDNGGIKIKKRDLEPVGLIDFYRGDESQAPYGKPNFRVMCYRVTKYRGEPVSTTEMRDPQWFPIDKIPFGTEEMKAGDQFFVPQIIKGTPVKGWIRFIDDKTLIGHDIQPCSIEDLVA